MGAYSYEIVGSGMEIYDRLAKSTGRLFFAGEATSRSFPGTVHGAYASGTRAAGEITRAYVEKLARCNDEGRTAVGDRYGEGDLLPLQISRL
jgi:polyamine oxidase